MAKSVVLLGKGRLAVSIAEWFMRSDEYELLAIVPVVPEPRWTDSLIAWCRAHEVAYVASGRYQDIPAVKNAGWRVDLAFSVFCDTIIKPWFIEKCGRILNLHNGPVPRYRGVSPINWALKNREQEHGVTIHEITSGVDSGPIVSQMKYSIYPDFDEVVDVYERALEYGYLLFAQTMPILNRIKARPQDESRALYYSRKDREQLGDRRDFTRDPLGRRPVMPTILTTATSKIEVALPISPPERQQTCPQPDPRSV